LGPRNGTDRKVGPTATGATVDLTPEVAGTYGYLLKITLKGSPGRAMVRSLRITTWVQVAPAALPSLRRGVNRMELRAGDHHGLDTRVVEIRPNGADPADLLKYCAVPPADYDPARRTSRIHSPFVVRVPAPPGTRIAWFSAGGSFQTHRLERARDTLATIGWAAGNPGGFQELYRAAVPPETVHWHFNGDREVRLDVPARTVYLRYEGDPAVNNIRVYAHCVEEKPRARGPIRIRHGWREEGAPRTRTVTLRGPGAYTITCDREPVDEFVELAVPSGRTTN
jgi:hypothetical protein